MKSPTRKLSLIIAGTILLPLIIYSTYEISSIKEDEEVIERVYRDQVDAILFSVNQFSNDIITGLIDKLENRLQDSVTLSDQDPFLVFSNFKVLFFESIDAGTVSTLVLDDRFGQTDWKKVYPTIGDSLYTLKEQLIRYKEGGYRKIEPKGRYTHEGINCQVIYAMLENARGEMVLLTGLIDISGFAVDVLAPKLQQIAEDDLVIVLSEMNQPDYLYLTDSLSKEIMYKKPMWLFPDFEIGISSKNKTVRELVRERTQFNLIATFVLIGLLVFGFVLVVFNLRREIQLAQTRSDFVSNVSHELRTPLSLISMFAETLMLDRVPSWEKRKEYEEIIYKETNRLTNIVNKILNFSQIEGNRKTYHPVEVHLNKLVDELIHDYQHHLWRNGFTFEFWRHDSLPPIWVDKEALYEALVNLLDNAIKYSRDERHVIFRTNVEEKRIYVELEDRGIGIAADQIEQIFEKFYRVSEGNVHTTQGAGLGLALVSHIVHAHGGDIEVESTPSKGSLFRLVFYLQKNGPNTGSGG